MCETTSTEPRPGLPARAGMAAIRFYRRCLSKPMHALLGPNSGCRFTPSCSEYALDALRSRGLAHGALLTAWRILRCHPFHPGGHDPAPEKKPRG